MIVLLLVIHVLIAISLVGVILLQKSEGGALGMGGGGMSGFMTGRSTANLLTRATAILAAAFMLTSILLVWSSNRARVPHSLLGSGAPTSQGMPLQPTPANPGKPAPQVPVKPAPAAPAAPTPPLAK